MQKTVIGILAVLLLFFAAAYVRLADRQRSLEAQVAALESRAREKASKKAEGLPQPATPLEPAATVSTDPVSPKPAAAKTEAPPPAFKSREAKPAVAELAQRNLAALSQTLTRKAWITLNRGGSESDLGLSESQKRAIEDLRTARTAQTQVYRDQIQRIDDQTELSIRQLLDAQQLQKYDAGGSLDPASFQVLAQAAVPAPEDPALGGQKPGYLGISGGDADGGGAQITDVMKNMVASTAGLSVGDVILEFNGEKISNFSGLATKIRSLGEGAPVNLLIRRGGSEFYQGLQLGARPR